MTGLPSWVDASREVEVHDVDVTPAAFVAESRAELDALGITGERAVEVVAHCAAESAFGRKAVGFNVGGVKLKRDDDAAYRAKHGHGLAWGRKPGHLEAGDAAVVLYRAFDSPGDFWRFWAKRYVPLGAQPSDRYRETGAAFWGPTPARWFVELLAAGYRGPVREREIKDLIASGDPERHPSVRAHRDLVRRVRAMVGL